MSIIFAILLELVTITYWFKLRSYVKPAFWWSAMIAMTLVLLHCAGYWTNSLLLSRATANSNAALVLIMVMVAKHTITNKNQLEQKVVLLDKAVESERGIALALAKKLADHNAKIAYYENQAKTHGLPLIGKDA